MFHSWQCLLAVGQSLPAPSISESITSHLPPQTLTALSSGWVKPARGVDQGNGSLPVTLLPCTHG